MGSLTHGWLYVAAAFACILVACNEEGSSGTLPVAGAPSGGAGPSGGAAGTAGAGGQGAAGGQATGGSGGVPDDCVGFYDELDGHALPFAVVSGGEFSTEGGWTVTANFQKIEWPGQRIATEGRLEFEVKGLGPDQECGGNPVQSAGYCRLWWFAANDQATPNTSNWSGTGRRIAQNFLCNGDTTCMGNGIDYYIDRVRMHANWIPGINVWSDQKFEWVASTWYHMTAHWDCKRLAWYRRTDGSSDVLLAEDVYLPNDPQAEKCYEPESEGGTEMIFMVGGGSFGSVGATFRNVRYTPIVCSDVRPTG